jgi:electron transport complex protein RnfB
MIPAVIALASLAALFGLMLGFAAVRFRSDDDPVVDQIEALLPKTQCAQCDYPGCRPYAEAIASGEAEINRCPPGGEAGIRALADLLDRDVMPLDPERGVEKPRELAVIIEDLCIGCTLCIQACPVDAILGASKQMHTVIGSECVGCELCLPPCPVDCIEMVPEPVTTATWTWPKPIVGLAARKTMAESPGS